MSLPSPTVTGGRTQSRPFPARAGKVMESGWHLTRKCAALHRKNQIAQSLITGTGQMQHALSAQGQRNSLKPVSLAPVHWSVSEAIANRQNQSGEANAAEVNPSLRDSRERPALLNSSRK